MNRFERLLNIPCTINHRTVSGEDPYGTPTYSTQTFTTNCWLDQLVRSEKGVDAVDTEKWRCYLSANVSIETNDTIETMGLTFEVDGPPWRVVDPRTGSVHHVEATLRRTN